MLSLRYARRDEGSGSIGFMATSALVLGFILMAHFNVFPFALAIFGISALVRLFVKKNLDGVIVPDSGTVISTIKELAIFAAILFAIILFFIIPPVVYKQYTSSVKFSLEPFNAGAFVSNLFGNASSSDYDEKLGLLFGAAFVIAILANVFSIFSARKVEWFHVLFAVILIAFAVLQILGGLNEMFAQMVVSFIRIEYFLLIAMSIVIASLLKITNFDIESGKYGAIGIVAAIVIILVIASSATVTSKRSVSWVTDQFIKSNSANPSPFFANEVTGRITTYGMYATIIHPGLTIAYGLDTNGMGFIPGQHTDIYQQKLNDIYAGWLLPKSTTAEDAYKLYQMTGVTTIWVNVCTPGGSQTVQRFESCVQGVKPTCPLGGKQFSQCDVMLFINSSLAKETGGSKGAFNFASYSETSLADAAYETVSDQKIKFVPQFPSGYILMKQEYFPRWKAVQEGVGQVEVGKSDIGLLVVENRNGKPISLNYEFELWEKLLLFVSVVGVASSFAFSVRFHPYF
ncbi:TPA: hypothetical protein HA238_06490 [Candidatus Micrarchaeota archaeon]|nr:hypothetical protein [Candidatus Micrarchaeota archaeon]